MRQRGLREKPQRDAHGKGGHCDERKPLNLVEFNALLVLPRGLGVKILRLSRETRLQRRKRTVTATATSTAMSGNGNVNLLRGKPQWLGPAPGARHPQLPGM